MKKRNGFVTNSSSSSFICDVCSRTEAGYDMSLSDAQMYTCKEGHTFCEEHVIGTIDDDFDRYEVDIKHCPICTFNIMHQNDTLTFLMKEHNLTETKILETLKDKFGDYKSFAQYIKPTK